MNELKKTAKPITVVELNAFIFGVRCICSIFEVLAIGRCRNHFDVGLSI